MKKQGLFMSPPSAAANTLTLARPDDWHLHLRDGDALRVLGCRVGACLPAEQSSCPTSGRR